MAYNELTGLDLENPAQTRDKLEQLATDLLEVQKGSWMAKEVSGYLEHIQKPDITADGLFEATKIFTEGFSRNNGFSDEVIEIADTMDLLAGAQKAHSDFQEAVKHLGKPPSDEAPSSAPKLNSEPSVRPPGGSFGL
jgi:hypothetical protein